MRFRVTVIVMPPIAIVCSISTPSSTAPNLNARRINACWNKPQTESTEHPGVYLTAVLFSVTSGFLRRLRVSRVCDERELKILVGA